MTANTLSMNAPGTLSWNRSDMLLTNTRCGFRQESGSSSVLDCPHDAVPLRPALLCFVRPSYGLPRPGNLCACFIA